jgi:hypothetical protein
MEHSKDLMERRKLALAQRLLVSPQKALWQFLQAIGMTLFASICLVALWHAPNSAERIARLAGIFLTFLALVITTLLSYVRYLDWRRIVSSKRNA